MLQTVYNILKVTAIIVVSSVFLASIHSLLGMVSQTQFGTIVTEIFDLMSMFLPFNASAVFGAIAMVLEVILTFLLAKKVYDLTSWSLSTS